MWRKVVRWLKREPLTAAELRQRGLKRLRKGDAKGALRFLAQALSLEPSNFECRINMGVALYLLRRYDEALEHFRFASALDPQNATALLNLAATHDALGQLDEALKVLQKVTHLFPDMPDVHYNLAVALARKGETDAAITQLRLELERNPTHPHALKLMQQLMGKR